MQAPGQTRLSAEGPHVLVELVILWSLQPSRSSMSPGLGESASGPLTYHSLSPLTNLWKILRDPSYKA